MLEQATPSANSLAPASLDDPLYYLKNLQAVVRWVTAHHHDLLNAEELEVLHRFLQLAMPAQALLARMIIRKGEIFRSDKLEYQEILSSQSALDELGQQGFIDTKPQISIEQLYQHCRRDELLNLLHATGSTLPKSAKKSELLSALKALELAAGANSLDRWWPAAPFSLVSLQCMAVFDRLRLMFFGNLHQDWSEFVLTELGHQSYETVAFEPQFRAFASREDIDNYLALHHCQTALQEATEISTILPLLLSQLSNPWLEYRRQRLEFQIAQQAERAGDIPLAIELYTGNVLDEAKVRLYRVLEKNSDDIAAVIHDIEQDLQITFRLETRIHLQRILRRLSGKVGKPRSQPKRQTLPLIELSLCETGQRVEFATLEALTKEGYLQGFYTENWLFTGLLGLLFWPVLFEPLPGAFFHPFQAGPADLYRPDFGARRQRQIEARLATLDSGEYRVLIKKCWQEKFGIACSLVHWPVISETLLDLALATIPAAHLKTIFTHLLADLRNHRRGMPDLCVFDRRQQSYKLIEVKGPGDRLQDHQTLWIETMINAGIPIAVAQVQWQATQ